MIVSVIGAGAIGSAVAKSLIESRAVDYVIASRRRVEKIRELKKIEAQGCRKGSQRNTRRNKGETGNLNGSRREPQLLKEDRPRSQVCEGDA